MISSLSAEARGNGQGSSRRKQKTEADFTKGIWLNDNPDWEWWWLPYCYLAGIADMNTLFCKCYHHYFSILQYIITDYIDSDLSAPPDWEGSTSLLSKSPMWPTQKGFTLRFLHVFAMC